MKINLTMQTMTNKTDFSEVLTQTNLGSKESGPYDPAMNNFSVIEDLYITKEACLKNELWSDTMSVFIVTEGSGKLNLDSKEMDIHENSMVQLVTSNVDKMSVEGKPFLVSGISFTNNFIKEMGIMGGFLSNIFSFFSSGTFLVWDLKSEDTNMVKHQIRLLADYVRSFTIHPYGKEIFTHAFYVFLFEIEALYMKHRSLSLPSSRQEIHVHKFINLVQQQFRKVRTIKEYAAQLNVSAKHLTEIVKHFTGKNASEMITEQVIREAKFLLKNPQLSIGEIAYKLYFSDQSFFGKYFKRQTGISPKAYRESVFSN